MSPKTKRFLITTETHEIVVIHQSDSTSLRGFCEECKQEVDLLIVDQDTCLVESAQPEPLLKRNPIHKIKSQGKEFICRNSLVSLLALMHGEQQ